MGLRVSEVVNLRCRDISFSNLNIRVVDGKYNRDRDIPIPPFMLEILDRWNEIRPKSEWFFCTLKGGKLKVRYIQAMVERYSKKAGIDKRVSPHTLRHTFATDFYRQTLKLEELRKLLGHADLSTTQIYVNLAGVDIKNAMNGYKGQI